MKTMMKMTLVAPFLLATGVATAATQDFGLLGVGDNFHTVESYTTGVDPATYNNDYLFQLGSNLQVTGILDNWLVPPDKVSSNPMMVDFFVDNAGTWDLLNSWNVASGSLVNYNQNIGPGSYRINVAGNVTGTNGSSYTIDGMVSAVPEPSTYALMLGGLGLVGFMAARRRKS